MSGVEVLAAGAIVGEGLNLYGQISGAKAQAEAAKQEAALKNKQADELLSRESSNEELMRDRADLQKLDFGASFAATGREGAGLGGQLMIKKQTDEMIANSRRDAEFKAQMLRAGANIETGLASDMVTASYISGAGSVLGAGAKAYSIYKGPSSPQALPKLPG